MKSEFWRIECQAKYKEEIYENFLLKVEILR